jgi:DNA-binding transcriptional MerR regulator
MAKERVVIGELSRRSSVPVKTLRFYSDEGLLPPAERSRSGYRLYGDDAVLRVDLIRTLREAGLGLAAIKKVLRRETSLADALRLRLAAVEAHVASLQRIAAALRAALRSEPNEDDVRRLCAVTRLSNEERTAVIEGFYDRVSEGIPIDEKWKQEMVHASAPKLPDNPTPEQLDAWIELAEILADPKFVENMRANAKDVWGRVDMTAFRQANDEAAAEARSALARGVAPESEEAKAVVVRYALAMGAAQGKAIDLEDPNVRRGFRERFARQDPRGGRYWELVAVLRGSPMVQTRVDDWKWIGAAVLHHLA